MSKNILTVAFTYEAGSKIVEQLFKSMTENKDVEGVTVFAISREDEFARVEELDQELGQ